MTDQRKPDQHPDQQDAPKTDNPPQVDAVEVAKPPVPSKPDDSPKANPLAQKPAPEMDAPKVVPGAMLDDTAKPSENDDGTKAANGVGTQPGLKAEGIVTRDLSDSHNPEPEKSAGGSSIPSPLPQKNVPPAGEPKATQRLPDPESLGVSSGTASGGITCPNCSHRNRPGILVCENCGTNLMTGRQSGIGTRDLLKEQEKQGALDAEAQKAVDTAGGASFTEEMVLRIEIEGGSTPMLVYPKQEIIMGRRDPNTGGMPDVDLTAYAGYRMGVSRRHAAVRLQDKQLHVSDLGSSNGTFLNGTRLNAHRPYQLKDGDEVRLGQMVLRLYFQSNKDRR
ncbi:MAG: FHA domain-containing protein [Chloroflexota bacterium]